MLQQAARGERELTADALTGLLADCILEADSYGRDLGSHRNVLLRMIVEDGEKKRGTPDLLAALDAIGKVDALQRSSLSELRKTVELLWRMSGPTRPKVKVLDARPKPAAVSLGRP